jgi:hypothetical protein
VQPALQRAHDAQEGAIDYGPLPALSPGWQVGVYAEGTAAVLEQAVAPWAAAAAASPEPHDDAYVALYGEAWGNLDGSGWPAWAARNWDYGGCSTFGSGLHLRLLQGIDAAMAAGGPFTAELVELRTGVLRDILEDSPEFPYCDATAPGPTPPAVLLAELDAIRQGVRLSEAEAADLRSRRGRFGGTEAAGAAP